MSFYFISLFNFDNRMQYLYNVPGRHKFLFIITILLVLAGKQKREVLRRIEESHLKIELNRLEKELFYLEKDLVLEPKLYESEHNILPEKHIEETIRPENPDIELIITNPKTTNQQNLTNRLIFRPTKSVILILQVAGKVIFSFLSTNFTIYYKFHWAQSKCI